MKFIVEKSNKIDLHIHTEISDGYDSIEEIVEQAITLGLECISITDHNADEVGGYCDRKEIKKLYNLEILSGSELSVVHNNKRLHLLAYGYHSMFSKFVIPRIADMRDKGKPLTMKKACALIHLFGGKAIIAHPFKYKYDGRALVDELLKTKCFDGIECIHSFHTQDEIDYLLDVCQKHNLYVSAGSDYHYSGRRLRGNYLQKMVSELPVSDSTIENQLIKAKEKYNTISKKK